MTKMIRGRRQKKHWLLVLFLLTAVLLVHAQKNENCIGAKMPYVRYEADKGELGADAYKVGPSFQVEDIAAEASERVYVELPSKGSFVKWKVKTNADGITLRFSIPDSEDGNGQYGQLSLFVNNQFIRKVEVNSHHAWQYFYKKQGKDHHPHNDPNIGNPRMRFDEVRFIIPELKKGDEICLKKTVEDNISYGVDFIEVEKIAPKIEKPEGYIDITDLTFGAIPNDDTDDFHAFEKAIEYAIKNKCGIYIPAGKYRLSNQIRLDYDGLVLQGAGIWHTHLHFTKKNGVGKKGGGIYANGSKLKVSDMYLTSELNNRKGGYRAFGQYWGNNSLIQNVWVSHFSVGFWIADYETKPSKSSNGLTVRNCRIRNTYADGLNFAKGSSNCVLEYSNIRNTGDDAMASWSSDSARVGPNINNIFRFNTVENTMRAGGVGIFGGKKHKVYNCIFKDSYAGPGIRVNSTFPGWAFDNNSEIEIYNNKIIRCGTNKNLWNNKLGAININVRLYDVRNIYFHNIEIEDSAVDAVQITCVTNSYIIDNVRFEKIRIKQTGMVAGEKEYGFFVGKKVKGSVLQKEIEIEKSKKDKILSKDFRNIKY